MTDKSPFSSQEMISYQSCRCFHQQLVKKHHLSWSDFLFVHCIFFLNFFLFYASLGGWHEHTEKSPFSSQEMTSYQSCRCFHQQLVKKHHLSWSDFLFVHCIFFLKFFLFSLLLVADMSILSFLLGVEDPMSTVSKSWTIIIIYVCMYLFI